MGYYTAYTLELLDPKTRAPLPEPQRVLYGRRVLDALDYWGSTPWPADPGPLDLGREKWYDWEKDITSASEHVPVLLRLHGVGEEYGDEWVAYAYRGCVVTFKRPAWDFPLPDPANLPAVLPLVDPALARIEAFVRHLPHESHCSAPGRRESPCTCLVSVVASHLYANPADSAEDANLVEDADSAEKL